MPFPTRNGAHPTENGDDPFNCIVYAVYLSLLVIYVEQLLIGPQASEIIYGLIDSHLYNRRGWDFGVCGGWYIVSVAHRSSI